MAGPSAFVSSAVLEDVSFAFASSLGDDVVAVSIEALLDEYGSYGFGCDLLSFATLLLRGRIF